MWVSELKLRPPDSVVHTLPDKPSQQPCCHDLKFNTRWSRHMSFSRSIKEKIKVHDKKDHHESRHKCNGWIYVDSIKFTSPYRNHFFSMPWNLENFNYETGAKSKVLVFILRKRDKMVDVQDILIIRLLEGGCILRWSLANGYLETHPWYQRDKGESIKLLGEYGLISALGMLIIFSPDSTWVAPASVLVLLLLLCFFLVVIDLSHIDK